MLEALAIMGIYALGILAIGTLVWAVSTFAPKAIDFVKSFIRWHSHDDDDWYL